jgi:hypothetical protein
VGNQTSLQATNQQVQATTQTKENNTTNSTPEAVDFVSLRPALAILPAQSLSEAEKTTLLYMRKEEK